MKLILGKAFEFLEPLEIEIGNFTVFTGINGSGKSQLLRALANGQAKLDDHQHQSIQMLNPQNFRPLTSDGIGHRNAKNFQYPDWYDEYKAKYSEIMSRLDEKARKLGQRVRSPDILSKGYRLFEEIGIDDYHIEERDIRSLIESMFGKTFLEELLQDYQNIFRFDANWLASKMATDTTTDIFNETVQKTFEKYRLKLATNNYNRYLNSIGENVVFHPEETFKKIYGEPPWDKLQNIIDRYGLNVGLKINNLNIYDKEKTLSVNIFNKLKPNNELNQNSISSGEKVLLSLALSEYRLQDKYNIIDTKIAYLFDEPDSALHPSAIKIMIDILRIELSKKSSVIMTTHSPTTVALSPEGSIYEITEGKKIAPVRRADAIKKLTIGLPTVSIDIDARREVFVEDENDAKLYNNLYTSLSKFISSEISLNFIGVGTKNSRGESSNSGCGAVNKIVKELQSNPRIYGLIDGDTRNKSKEKLYVLDNGKRYSIENYLYDPLVVMIAANTKSPNFFKNQFGTDKILSNHEILSLPAETLQDFANKIQAAALQCNTEDLDEEQNSLSKYVGCDITLELTKQFCEMRGHDLAKHILSWCNLKQNHMPAHNLEFEVMEWITKVVLFQNFQIIPAGFHTTFSKLMQDDV